MHVGPIKLTIIFFLLSEVDTGGMVGICKFFLFRFTTRTRSLHIHLSSRHAPVRRLVVYAIGHMGAS